MPISSSDLVLYASVNQPSNDTNTTGGAVNTHVRAEFTQFAGPARIALVSDGADARVATVVFRDATGALVTETPALNGVSEVLTTATAERLLSVDLDATSSTRTVSVKEGSGGTVRGTIPQNETGFTAAFIASASESGAVNRYEKFHWMNNHSSLTLNTATVTLTADPAARITIGLTASKGDSSTIADRKNAPGGVSFSDDNVAISIPTGILAAGESIGMWVKQGLLAADAPIKSSYTTKLAGTSA